MLTEELPEVLISYSLFNQLSLFYSYANTFEIVRLYLGLNLYLKSIIISAIPFHPLSLEKYFTVQREKISATFAPSPNRGQNFLASSTVVICNTKHIANLMKCAARQIYEKYLASTNAPKLYGKKMKNTRTLHTIQVSSRTSQHHLRLAYPSRMQTVSTIARLSKINILQ